MPRLLLINPTNIHRGLGNIRSTAWPPLNLPYLAAVTPKHYQLSVIDENVESFEFQKADIVGITAYTATVTRAYEISRIYRKKGIRVVMGGIHVSMMPDEALNYCDSVVIGEAESVWPSVLNDVESGNLKDRYHGDWLSLEKLPIPRRDILKNSYYRWGSLQTSRGCPMNCSFCSVTAFNGRRFRRRPLDSVIDELAQIPQKRILLCDDNIIGYSQQDSEWLHSFFSKILEKNIKKIFFAQTSIQFGENPELVRLAARAGLKIVFVGMESVNPATLHAYGKTINLDRLRQNQLKEYIKRIRRAGIVFLGAFVLGSDEDDASVFPATLEFVKSSHIDVLQVTKPTPLPGTQLWSTLNENNRIINQNFPEAWNNYRFSRMLYKPARMSIEDVYEGYSRLKETYYSLWETIKRTLSTLLTTKSLIATIISLKLNTSYRRAFLDSENYRIYNRQNLKKNTSIL